MSEETAEYWKERYEAVIQMAQEDREELRGRIAELEGTLADIAFSDDMTLELARRKAKRLYEATAP